MVKKAPKLASQHVCMLHTRLWLNLSICSCCISMCTMCAPTALAALLCCTGYSALTIAKALPPSGKLISIEKDLQWVLAAKRFVWQASQGEKADRAGERLHWLRNRCGAAESGVQSGPPQGTLLACSNWQPPFGHSCPSVSKVLLVHTSTLPSTSQS